MEGDEENEVRGLVSKSNPLNLRDRKIMSNVNGPMLFSSLSFISMQLSIRVVVDVLPLFC